MDESPIQYFVILLRYKTMRFLFLFAIFSWCSFAWALDVPPYSFVVNGIDYLNTKPPKPCDPTVPSRPLVPRKEFSSLKSAPSEIKSAADAVKAICFCNNNYDTCATFTSVGGGDFITNEHALEGLLAQKKEYEASTGKKCDWVVALPNRGAAKITFNIEQRGWWNHKDSKYNGLDHSRDLARVHIPELSQTPALSIARSPLRSGDKLYVLGYPIPTTYVPADNMAMIPAVSDGVVTSLNPVNNSADFIGANGMSGGPVLNSKGDMVGIFWGKELNQRDSSLFDGNSGLPVNLPRETSYFIPAEQVQKIIPRPTLLNRVIQAFK